MPENPYLRKLRSIEAFLMGAGSVWCIMPMVSQSVKFEIVWHSDSDAIASDWRAVGSDLRNAMQGAGSIIHEETR